MKDKSIKKNPLPPGTLPKSVFVLSITTEKKDNKLKVKNTLMSFDAPTEPALMNGDNITPIGFKVLIGTLADTVNRLAELAETQAGLKASELKESAIAKLGVKQAKVVKLIGV